MIQRGGAPADSPRVVSLLHPLFPTLGGRDWRAGGACWRWCGRHVALRATVFPAAGGGAGLPRFQASRPFYCYITTTNDNDEKKSIGASAATSPLKPGRGHGDLDLRLYILPVAARRRARHLPRNICNKSTPPVGTLYEAPGRFPGGGQRPNSKLVISGLAGVLYL